MKSLILLPLLFSACAQTTLYRDGKVIARFQGDMSKVSYADGDIHFAADSVNHSAATLAQGEAADSKIKAVGIAVATSGIATLLK